MHTESKIQGKQHCLSQRRAGHIASRRGGNVASTEAENTVSLRQIQNAEHRDAF